MTGGHPRRALPVDYDHDPERFAVNQAATAAYSALGDVHGPVARRLATPSVGDVLDLGGGTGTLATELAALGVRAVVVDEAAHLVHAPRPAVRADLRSLPFRDDSFVAAACLFVLYHLDDPREALCEAARVLRPGGRFVASTTARTNDPELAAVLPGWGAPGTFDAEDAADIVGSVLTDVEVEHWDAPVVELPDREAVALFLRGRGLSARDAERHADTFTTPMRITKRGCLIWARGPRRDMQRTRPSGGRAAGSRAGRRGESAQPSVYGSFDWKVRRPGRRGPPTEPDVDHRGHDRRDVP